MELAILGLGRMGGNMAERLLRGGHRVVVWNRTKSKIDEHVALGMEGAYEFSALPKLLKQSPRVVWFMLPAGQTTDDAIDAVAPLLNQGDIIIDGANSRWSDDKRRAPKLKALGLQYMDAGVSGGVWGLTEGYSLMVGGDAETFAYCEPIFKTLAPPTGNYGLMGPHGAGHFVKMVHNGIEYGMMQAYGEGFEILKKSEYSPDLLKVAQVWQQGSVVRSWLLDLAVNAFAKHGNDLARIKGWVADSGEGRWTVEAAMAEDVPAPVITLALIQRFVSRQDESFSAQVLAALRNEFGGHEVKSE
ncbi:MAG: 6-phosphogluconate dehydrogenase (decarboxylating) [Chloroflexi bacterium UTCFX4]|nr:MAG: 6-phosphogluconate dehydrogenase (decarboxylating) [Chloroflexi bacterium UTCFX4]